MRYLAVAFSILVCALAIKYPAQAKVLRTPKTLISISGTCKSLVSAGTDITRVCDGKVANVEYSDHRNSFTFVTTDGLVAMTFSGRGEDQVHNGPDIAIQPLDAIFLSFQGKPSTYKAVGKCLFSNPYKGPAPVSCSADTDEGHFVGEFLTDGSSPTVKQMH